MNMNSKIVSRFLGVALIASAVCGPQVFAADATGPVRTLTVKYADLNVGSQAGAATLYKRIHQAAKQVCSESDASKDLKALEMQKSCIARAESGAVDNVHSNALTAYYQTTLGHSYVVSASNNVK